MPVCVLTSGFKKAWIGALLSCCLPAFVHGDEPVGPTAKAANAYADDADEERFDLLVREDIFAGFEGDAKRLANGLKVCEATLAKNPQHAEAMVWRGAIRVFQSGQAFQQGDPGKGIRLWMSGLKDMDDAKKRRPNDIAVMIPRAAVMIGAGRNAPPAMGRPLLEAVRDDFEAIYEEQKDVLDHIGEHPLGELRMGLADVYRLLDQPAKSESQLRRVIEELPGTAYADRATRWLAAEPTTKLTHNCIGCHDG